MRLTEESIIIDSRAAGCRGAHTHWQQTGTAGTNVSKAHLMVRQIYLREH